MNEVFLVLNQPVVLWTLFGMSVSLVLIDYLFPVDWPAYLGYVLFGVFIGATVSLDPAFSLLATLAVILLMLTLHRAIFSKYLTNLPRHERKRLECRPAVANASVEGSQQKDADSNVVR